MRRLPARLAVQGRLRQAGSEAPVGSASIAGQVIARMAPKQASVGSIHRSQSQIPTWYSAFRVTPLWQ
jgi:hypothetical protein